MKIIKIVLAVVLGISVSFAAYAQMALPPLKTITATKEEINKMAGCGPLLRRNSGRLP